MANYGTVAKALALCPHITPDQTDNPTTSDIQHWLDARSAMLDGWIAAAGFVTPITHPIAKPALDRFAEYGCASDMESSQRNAGYSSDDEDRREVWLETEFAKAEDWINSGILRGFDIPMIDPSASTAGGTSVGLIRRGACVSVAKPTGFLRD